MQRVLIVEDDEEKADMLTLFIKTYCIECRIDYAVTYSQAMLNLKKPYDLALFDNFLGAGDGYGYEAAIMYQNAWPEALVFVYSGDVEKARQMSLGIVRCYSSEEIKTQILLAIGKVNQNHQPKEVSPMNEFSRELCDEKHRNLEHILNKIDKGQDILFARLNWFFLLAIGTLASCIATIGFSCAHK